jgi:precorrin-2 dehydrogenase/sirohydrochlorin ferrochelatase
MPSYYPIYLDIKERACVVIGGGGEAERKVTSLLECGGKVTVVSPEVTVGIQDLASRGLIDWISKGYEVGDLEGAFLAVAENDNPKVYREVAWEAQRKNILLNVVDVTELCSFISPAVARRGEVAFAITTGGLSPALARRLREELEESSVMRWAEMADMIAEVRLEVRGKGLRPDAERWQECMDEEMLDLYESGRRDRAKDRLLRMLQEEPSTTSEVLP